MPVIKDMEALRTLLGYIGKTMNLLHGQEQAYLAFLEQDAPRLVQQRSLAMLHASFLADYYTCAETCFWRIAQFFENSLDGQRWHKDLLDRMRIAIPGMREAVIQDEVHDALQELMRFRHFRRYYFEMNYDMAKIEYLREKLHFLHRELPLDLLRFQTFLQNLLHQMTSEEEPPWPEKNNQTP